MKKEILRCVCGAYTLQKACQKCKGITVSPKPARYSPQDKYGHWRRLYKKS